MINPLILSDNDTFLKLDSETYAILEQAFFLIQERLRDFASDSDFHEKLTLAFGENFDTDAAQTLTQDWREAKFGGLPAIAILSSQTMNGAFGGYSVRLGGFTCLKRLFVKIRIISIA